MIQFTYKDSDSIHIIYLAGDLSESVNDELTEHISNKIKENNYYHIIDLAGIKRINSQGIGLLIKILTKTRTAGGETVLVNLPIELSKILSITKLNTIFKIFDDMDKAIGSLTKTIKAYGC